MELRIKDILREKNISQKELAERLRITEVGLSKSLNGNPSLSRLTEIAEALNVPLTDLFVSENARLHCPNCGAELELKKKE